MKKAIDLTGQKFGRLTVVKRAENTKDNKAQWLCECECGNTKIVRSVSLKSGDTKSCGCIRENQNKTHGKSKTRLHTIWANMIQRCLNVHNERYKDYGGRGITVCEEWRKFESFYLWANANGYKNGLTIDRINNDKGYSPDNCRWATVKEQNNNTRKCRYITYKGKAQTIKQWAEELNINYDTLISRINKLHWSIEKALSTP